MVEKVGNIEILLVMITDISFSFSFPSYVFLIIWSTPLYLVLEYSRTIHYVLRSSLMTKYSRLLYDLDDSIWFQSVPFVPSMPVIS